MKTTSDRQSDLFDTNLQARIHRILNIALKLQLNSSKTISQGLQWNKPDRTLFIIPT